MRTKVSYADDIMTATNSISEDSTMTSGSQERRIKLFLRCILVLTALMCIECENDSDKGTMECRDDGDTIVCEFTLNKNNRDVSLNLEYCQNDFCVKTTVLKEMSEAKEKNEVFQDELRAYEPPFEQYGRNVARVLQRRPSEQQATVEGILKFADWYSDLGKAYRQDAMIGSAVDWDKMNTDGCIEAFQHAVAAYNRALSQKAPIDTRISLGTAETFLAESLLFHRSIPQRNKALKHFMNAEEHFRQVLESKTLSDLDHASVEVNWADTLSHAASLLLDDSAEMEGGELSIDSVVDVNRFLESAEKSDRMLTDAVRVYRKTLDTAVGEDSIFYQLQLANALHNLGTARMLTSSVGKAIAVMEEARVVFENVILKVKGRRLDQDDTVMGMTELLISLSDAYLQAGNYVDSKIRYKNAMDWYKQHKLVPLDVPAVRSDELLVEMEEQLAEYHASLIGGNEIQIPDDYRRPGEPLYEPDDRYEADLHAAIGSIYLSHGEVELAMTKFVKAIDMYEELGGEERAIADVKLSMANALLRLQKFDESSKAHAEAVDIYRKVVGDGKNPLVVEGALMDKGSGNEPVNAENDNAFRAQLVNMEVMQKVVANRTAKEEL